MDNQQDNRQAAAIHAGRAADLKQKALHESGRDGQVPGQGSGQKPGLSAATLAKIHTYQREEVTEAAIYHRIAARTKDPANRTTLESIANEEEHHAARWKHYTHEQMKPKAWTVFWYSTIARTLGFTFAMKLMEKNERRAQRDYEALGREAPEALDILKDEHGHEQELIDMLDEERLTYVGSIMLGLNDAMVEMSGSLAGFTLAMQNTRVIALAGLITGIAATLSMASSEYLARRSDNRGNSLGGALYTGGSYMVVVILLILPYLLLGDEQYYAALIIMIVTVLAIIALFNFYLSVAQGVSFRKRFLQMAAISLGVASLSFILGLLMRTFLGVDI